MIIYLLKFIACSGVLLLFYHFVLQSDRLFKFNRFFLLAIVGLALLIPITTVRTNYIEIPATENRTYQEVTNSEEPFQSLSQRVFTEEVVSIPLLTTERIFIGSYLLITLLLLTRFGTNLYSINRLKRNVNVVQYSDINIVLRSDISASFSFLDYMFTNKEVYEQGNLPEEIILHEKLHIKQHHSIDIIFIELLQCFFWINPFIYFIRKAIKLNHEFQADAFVIGGNTSAQNYQKILLDFTGKHLAKSPLLASNLNYGFTKKRLNMMVKNTNTWSAIVKQLGTFAIIIATFSVLGITEVVAQFEENKTEASNLFEKEDKQKPTTDSIHSLQNSQRAAGFFSTKDGRVLKLSGETFTEAFFLARADTFGYKHGNALWLLFTSSTPVKYLDKNGQSIAKPYKELNSEQQEWFWSINKSQAASYRLPPKAIKPTNAQLQDYQDSNMYGVWLDGVRIDNTQLKTLTPQDIHRSIVSKLYFKSQKKKANYEIKIDLTSTIKFVKAYSTRMEGWWEPVSLKR